MRTLALALALFTQDARPPSDPQQAFDQRVFALWENEVELRDVLASRPARAWTLAHEMLRSSAQRGDAQQAVAARRVAELAGVDLVAQMAGEPELALALAARERGQLDEAERHYAAALEAALETDDLYSLALRLRLLGETRARLDDTEGARTALGEALELSREKGARGRVGRIDARMKLGHLELAIGHYVAALEHYQAADRQLRAAGEGEWAPAPDLALAHSLLGHFERGRTELERCLEQPRVRADPALLAWVRSMRASLFSGAGRYAEALEETLVAVNESHAAGDELAEARALVTQGGIQSEVGLQADARVAIERALELFNRVGGALDQGRARIALGLALLDDDQAAAALEPLRDARALLTEAGDVFGPAEAEQHLGAALLALDRPEDAERILRSARARWRATDDHFRSALTAALHGDALTDCDRADEAERAYRDALAAAQRTASLELAWRAELGLGRLAEARADRGGALDAYLAAIEDLETLRGSLVAPSARARFLAPRLEVYRRAAALLGQSGALERSFALADAAHARTLSELRAAGVAPKDSGEWTAVRSALRLAELRLNERSAAGELSRAHLESELERLRAEHAGLRRQRARNDPRAAGLAGLSESVSLKEVQRALPEGSVLIQYLVGDEGCVAWVATRDAARFTQLAIEGTALAEAVDALERPLAALRAGTVDLANLRFDARRAAALYDVLVAPFAEELEQAELLLVVPDGPLRRLSFAALVRERERRAVEPGALFAQYRGCRFLVDDLALAVLPTAGLLTHPAPSGAQGSVALADPATHLAALPGARLEVDALRPLLDPLEVAVGDAASERFFRERAPHAGTLHVAAHGVSDDRRPAWSHLALAPGAGEDGRLYAHEVERLALAGTRVVLSACDTVGSGGHGEGWMGLSRAFLQAGAHSVVASLWLADDAATAELLAHMHRGAASGMDGPAALRAAQLDVLGRVRDGRIHLVHPFFWAGFVHVGPP
jgi:CHAT domain-containing protein